MSYLATRPRDTGESAGSRTLTVTNTPTDDGSSREQTPNAEAGPSIQQQPPRKVGVLKLRGGPRKPRVVWSEGTVDNEHMGKKKSKICCIYHKPKAFDESSSESGSDSDSSCSSHSHSHSPKRGNMKMKKRDSGPGGVQEDDSSSESEGGAGDGSARPSKGKAGRRKPLGDAKGPMNGDAGHPPADSGKANKYDHQARSK